MFYLLFSLIIIVLGVSVTLMKGQITNLRTQNADMESQIADLRNQNTDFEGQMEGYEIVCKNDIKIISEQKKKIDNLNNQLNYEINHKKELVEYFKSEIADYESLPLISENITVFAAKCVEATPGYDSVWEIIGTNKGENFNVSITRLDIETISGIIKELKKCVSVNDIKALDRKSSINFD